MFIGIYSHTYIHIYIYTQTYSIFIKHMHAYIYDPGSAVPPPPPPPMVPPHPPPCGVVWWWVASLSPPCGVVWCGCGLLPPSLWCGVVRVWALVVPPLHPLWRGMGWVVPPACLDLLGVFGKPMLLDRGGHDLCDSCRFGAIGIRLQWVNCHRDRACQGTWST